MSSQQSSVQPQQSKAPSKPAAPSAPVPLDPNLFKHVGGGDGTSGPTKVW